MIFESHAHYDDEAFDKDREELLASFEGHGIGTVINIGASLSGSEATGGAVSFYIRSGRRAPERGGRAFGGRHGAAACAVRP